MAGIIATSVSKVMVSGDTSVNDTESGYVTAERITLSTSPAASSTYVWSLSIPNGSAAARSALSSTTAASPTFTPDVAGEYVVTCLVDGVITYTIRCTVVAAVVSYNVGGIRLMPTTDASIPTPSSGYTLYFSSTQNALAVKTSAGAVRTVDTTAV